MDVAGLQAAAGTLERVAAWIAKGELKVSIAAALSIEKIREAVALQASRQIRGEVVVTL